MDKVLITGGSGFIGQQVVQELLRKGYEVHSLINKQRLPDQEGLYQHKVSLFDTNEVNNFLAENHFEKLIHLAWCVDSKCLYSDANIDWLTASFNLLKAFINQRGKIFLGAGSMSEYDYSRGYLSEIQTPLTNPSLYGQAKASLYSIGQIYCNANNVSFKWARIFNVYGPNEKAIRLMPAVIRSIIQGEDVRVSDCMKIQDYSYVMDIAAAIVTFLESPVTGAVNICSGTPIRLRTIVEKISDLMDFNGRILWGAIPAKFEDPFVVGDNTRLTKEVGYSYQYDLETGLKQIIDWEKSHV